MEIIQHFIENLTSNVDFETLPNEDKQQQNSRVHATKMPGCFQRSIVNRWVRTSKLVIHFSV